MSVIGLCVLIAVMFASKSASVDESFWLLAICLPGIQFAGSIVAYFALLCSRRPGQKERLNHLRRITISATLWAIGGFLIMIPLLFMT